MGFLLKGCKMILSISKNNVNFKPVEVQSIDELAGLMLKNNYSQSIYKDNYRNLENFISTEMIGIDVDNDGIDDNYTIEAAHELFKDYKHIIAPSRSHRKEKHGKIADRFRVILFLEETVTNPKDFTATWTTLKEMYPAADDNCKDASRFFYPSPDIYSKNPNGKLIPITRFVEADKTDALETILGLGQLSKETMHFLLSGAPAGKRNAALFKAAKDMHEQGYPIEVTTERINQMIKTTKNWAHTELSDKDMQTVESAYSKEPKYKKREGLSTQSSAFTFKSAKEVLNSTETVDWVVDQMLTVGGFSIMAGPPKSGKSTLMRQLVLATSRGGEFLGRKVKQGPVIYLALEEQESVLKTQYKTVGLTEDDNVIIHTGGTTSQDPVRDLKDAILDFEPSLVVIDTLFLLMNIESINDYKQVNEAMAKFRNLARETNTHIVTVAHTKKDSESKGASRILGSVAIHGAVDSAMVLNVEENRRFLTTSQRFGTPMYEQELLFDKELQTYILGAPSKGSDF
jgi:hypothetical protein